MILILAASTVFNTIVVAWVVRRLLGAPVGWPRTILVSLVTGGLAPRLVAGYSRLTSLDFTGGVVLSPAGILLALLLLGWLLALQVGLLTFLEATLPTRPRTLTQMARNLPASYRRSRRTLAILMIAVRHGLPTFVRLGRRLSPDQMDQAAVSLYRALTEAGVTFVKLGQIIAARADVVPEPFVRELSRLQAQVDTLPWEELRPVVEATLPAPVEDVFEQVDTRPLAAASVGQVHAARLLDGTPVVIKVQRPDAPAQVAADLDILRRIAVRLERSALWARTMGVVALVDGFDRSLREELDYRTEDLNMTMLRRTLPDDPTVRVAIPQTYPELSGPRMLVMDRAAGRSLADGGAPDDPGARWMLADRLVSVLLHHIVVRGVFHADPHPGNIFVDPGGDVTLVDCGSVGRLDGPSRLAICSLAMSAGRGDCVTATDALLTVLDTPDEVDRRGLERDLGALLVQVGATAGTPHSKVMFTGILRLVTEHRLGVPPMVAAVFRALGTLEGTLRVLAPEDDLFQLTMRHAGRLAPGLPTPAEVRERVLAQAALAAPSLQRLPLRLDRIVTDLESGQLAVRVRGPEGLPLLGRVTGLVDQVILALMATTAVLAGLILMLLGGGGPLTPSVQVGTVAGAWLLLFGVVMGARSLVQIFRHAVTDR